MAWKLFGIKKGLGKIEYTERKLFPHDPSPFGVKRWLEATPLLVLYPCADVQSPKVRLREYAFFE